MLFNLLHKCNSVTTTEWTKLQAALLPAEWTELMELQPSTFPMVCSATPNAEHEPDEESTAGCSGLNRPSCSLLWLLLCSAPAECNRFQDACKDRKLHPEDVIQHYVDPTLGLAVAEQLEQLFTEHYADIARSSPKQDDDEEEFPAKPLLSHQLVQENLMLALSILSPTFAHDFLQATMDRYHTVSAFLSHIALHFEGGRQTALVQGLFGSGKTYTAGMLAYITTVLLCERMVWLSHHNKPLEEAASCLNFWMEACTLKSCKTTLQLLIKRLLASDQSAKYTLVDLPHEQRGDKTAFRPHILRCMIITTGAFAAACNVPYSSIKSFLLKGVWFLLFDEAQQFGDATDAWLTAIAKGGPLIVLIGDQQQPIGALQNRYGQKLICAQMQAKPGLFHAKLLPATPMQYLKTLELVDLQGNPSKDFSSYQSVAHLACQGAKLAPPANNDQFLGISGPGALLLPVSARVPHSVYAVAVTCVYSAQLVSVKHLPLTADPRDPSTQATLTLHKIAPRTTTTVAIGCPCFHSTMPPSQRGIRIDSATKSTLAEVFSGTTSILELDDFHSTTMENIRSIPVDEISSQASLHPRHCLRFGTYVIPFEYKSVSAKDSCDYGAFWLDDCLQLVFSAFTVFIFASIQSSRQQKFCLGFLCPWRCLNDEVTKRFDLAAIEQNTEQDRPQTLLDLLRQEIDEDLNNIGLEDIRQLLCSKPHVFAPFVVAGTSISSASANVRHSLVIVPRHTAFTGELAQALVSVTRAQGLQLLVAPPTALKGFFRLAIPMFAKLTGLLDFRVNVDSENAAELLRALRRSTPNPLTPTETLCRLGLNTGPTTLVTDLPLALILHTTYQQQTETCLLQLIISPASAHLDIPLWASLENRYMWAWRQLKPFCPQEGVDSKPYYLLQYSIAPKQPIFTLYWCHRNRRVPVAVLVDPTRPSQVILFNKYYTNNFQAAMRQATATELLNGDEQLFTNENHIVIQSSSAPEEPVYDDVDMPHADEAEDAGVQVMSKTAADAHANQSHPPGSTSTGEASTPTAKRKQSALTAPSANTTTENTSSSQDISDPLHFERLAAQRAVAKAVQTSLANINNRATEQDADALPDEDNDDLREVLGSIRNATSPQVIQNITNISMRQVALITTPTAWGILRFHTEKLYKQFTDALFVHGILMNANTAGTQHTTTILDLQDGFILFVANILASLCATILDYDHFLQHPHQQMARQLCSENFWLSQLRYACCHRGQTRLPKYALVRVLAPRPGNRVGHHAFRGDDPSLFPISSLVIFLPIQLILWMTCSLKDLILHGHKLEDHPQKPNLLVEDSVTDDSKGRGKSKSNTTVSNKIYKCRILATQWPHWPPSTNFPLALTRLQREAINQYVADRLKNNAGNYETALKSQVDLTPKPCIINLNLYECPPPWQNAEGDDNSYISRIASSGPLHMHSYLASCDWTLTKDTSEKKHILFKPDYEDKLKEQVAEAFTRPRPPQTFQPPTRHHPPQRPQSRPYSKKRRQDDSYTANSSASQTANWNQDRSTLSWQQHSWSSWQHGAGWSSSSNWTPANWR